MHTDKIVWPILGIILLIGVVSHTPTITYLAISLMAAAAAGRLWARTGLAHLQIQHNIEQDRSMVGDEINLDIRLDNPTVLPLPWVQVNCEIPVEQMQVKSGKSPQGLLRIRTGLSWFQRLRRTYSIQCLQRGYYRIRSSSVRVWDPLGLTFEQSSSSKTASVVIYPLTVPMEEINLGTDHPLGDPQWQRWLFLDPMTVAGARPYRPGDPLRWIHWPATASTGDIMTRNLEGTRTPEVLIFLNLQTMPKVWLGTVPELVELSITTAASIARWGCTSNYQVGLLSNGYLGKEEPEDSAVPLSIPPSGNPNQLRRILESLARCSGYGQRSLSGIITNYLRTSPSPATCLVVSAIVDEKLRSTIQHCRESGHHMVVFYTGNPPVPEIAGIRIIDVGGQKRWNEIVSKHTSSYS